MRDISHSGWNQYWLRAYFKGDRNPTFLGAFELSVRFEKFFDNQAPKSFRYSRKQKSHSWHWDEVAKAADDVREEGRIVFVPAAQDYVPTPYEQQAGVLLRHLVSTRDASPALYKLVSTVIVQAAGRNVVAISDSQLGQLMDCTSRTVGRIKKELRGHSCLVFDQSQQITTYNFHTEKPCPM
jgi:hypothetical protein